MGIDVNQTITFTFAIAGAAAGAAGLMWAQTTGTVAYNLGFQLGLIAFTAAVPVELEIFTAQYLAA